jgi:hypothetical protein
LAVIRSDILHENTIEPGDGDVALVEAYTSLAIYITGTSSSRTLKFQGAIIQDKFVDIEGANMSTMDMAATTTGTEQIWQFDVTDLKYFRVKVDAVAGGDVSIYCNYTA